MKRVTAGDQKTKSLLMYFDFGEPSTNWESNHKDHLLSAVLPLSSSTISRGYRWAEAPAWSQTGSVNIDVYSLPDIPGQQ